MSDHNFQENDANNSSITLEQLNTTEIFSFLKRYHNDVYPSDQSENKTACEGVYYETIVALEKLQHRLVTEADFIGYAKVDWDEACAQKNNIKKLKIINFYNDLIIDVELMQFAEKNYDFAPRVKAFIHFLDSEKECLFRLNVQRKSWTSENFPHEQIFQWVAKFKSFIDERKRIYQVVVGSNNGESHAKEIQTAISSTKRITQFIFLFKFDVSKLTNEELDEIILKSGVDHYLANQPRDQKLQSLVDELSKQHFGSRLPWLCRMTKIELEFKKHVKLQIGLILDSYHCKIRSDVIIRSLQLEIQNGLDRSWLRPFFTMEMVQIDQIFDQLGIGVIKEIILPNKKKTALMLKWFVGVFSGVNDVLRPLNLETENNYNDGKVFLKINSHYVEQLKCNDQGEREYTNSKKESSKPKKVDFSVIWNEKKLLKQLPDHFSFIHMFYVGLEYSEGLSQEEIQMLQRLNLFVAYLSECNLDGLLDRLMISKNHKEWPDVVQMFLSFIDTRLDCLLELKRWIYVDLLIIVKKLRNDPKVHSILRNLSASQSMHTIVEVLIDLQKVIRKSEQFQGLGHSTKLVRKNSRLAQNYINNSFKQNATVLRFQVDNRESKLDLKVLKQVFTQFVKRVGRAPKRIGADLDSYMGYFVSDRENYSIDFTAIFYARNEAPGSVSFTMGKYWKDYITELSEEGLKADCKNLKFSAIPTLWSSDKSAIFLVINKGDKITNQIKKDLVTFYTAYEFFNRDTSINYEGARRPELFLRGRTRMSVAKSAEKKEPQQVVNDVHIHEEDSVIDYADQNLESIADKKSVNVEVESIEPKNEEELVLNDERQRQEEWERIDKMRKERIAAFAKTIKPL